MVLATIGEPLRTIWLGALCVLAVVWVVEMARTIRRYERQDRLKEARARSFTTHRWLGDQPVDTSSIVVRIGLDTRAFTAGVAEAGRHLAKLGVASAVAAAASGQLTRRLWLSMDEQEAALRLTAVAGLGQLHLLGGEVERRTELFAAHYRDWPVEVPMTPRAAALRSVTEDVVTGRLCP